MKLIEYAYDFMENNLLIVEDYEYYGSAVKNIKKLYPSRIPFFDCLYMAVMEDLETTEILSFDKHFDLNKNIKRIY
ncbi:MAG: hypothetical protein FWH29_10100 [Methanobrevibacter sp.]|nr:hypothetical protein [Methanobrevibacter sp.]